MIVFIWTINSHIIIIIITINKSGPLKCKIESYYVETKIIMYVSGHPGSYLKGVSEM